MRRILIVSMVAGCLTACGGAQQPAVSSNAPAAAAPTATTEAKSSTPPAAAPTPAEKLAATSKALLDAWNTHDADKLASMYADGAILRVSGYPDFHGKEGVKAEAKATFAAFPDFKLAFTRELVQGKVVVYEWVVTGTNTGDMPGGPKATGRPMGVAGGSVIWFDDAGNVKEDHRYADNLTFASQLDPKAKPGTFRPVLALPAGDAEVHVSQGNDAEQKAIATANAMYQTIDDHKVDAFVGFVAEDAVFDDVAWPQSMKGKKDARDWLTGALATFPDVKQTRTLQFAADGWVVTEGVLNGTQKGPMGPVKATGKPVALHFVDIFHVTPDGKLSGGHTYDDGLEPLVEVGAAPALPH